MRSTTHNLLNAAYLYFYGTEVAFQPDAEKDGSLKKRLEELVGDALIVANEAKFDVFNALTLMDNVEFFSDLRVRHLVVSMLHQLKLSDTAFRLATVRCWKRSPQLLHLQLENVAARWDESC